jgi:aldose sugar dehydrogenase
MYSLASQVSASRILSVNLVIICIVSLTGYHSVASYAQESMPVLNDPELHVELITEELIDPTTMAFTGPGDVLVLEKSSGAVQRIVNGQMLPEPILDVNVNEKDERGLLGIAVSKNLPDNKTYVFLYYTEAEEDGGDPVGNRLYRYELVDNKLINPKLLLDLPYLPGPAHNGGTVKIGPDNIVYITIGELIETKYNGNDYNTLAQNYPNGKQPDGRGGILRVTQDGQIINGKGILGDNHPLNIYYAYGIRNSFGMDFDPVTGNLWETENGPKFGDEINLVEPGFNSGWSKLAGIWNVNMETNEEGDRAINKGEQQFSEPKNLVDFGGLGKYSPPEFTWEDTIAPTAVKFLDSNKLGEQYTNDMFVGSFLEGNIYHFDLTSNRSSLELDNMLQDKIANSPEEVEGILFGKGFGTVTDIEVSPDGNLYVLTGVRSDNGKLYRISP